MDIKGLLQQIDSTQQIARHNPDDFHFAVRSAHQTAIREAKDKLVGLKNQYADFCKRNCMGVFMYGDPKRINLFSNLVKDGGNVIVIDSGYPWEEWANELEPTFGLNREFSVTQLRLLINIVKEVADNLKIPVKEISQNSIPYMKDHKDLIEYLFFLVREAYGHSLYQAIIINQVVNQSIKRMIATAPMVLLTNLSEDLSEVGCEREAALRPLFINGHISLNLDDTAKEFAATDDTARESAIKLLTEQKKKIRSLRQPDKTNK